MITIRSHSVAFALQLSKPSKLLSNLQKWQKVCFYIPQPPIYSFLRIQARLRCIMAVLKSTTIVVENYDTEVLGRDDPTTVVMM